MSSIINTNIYITKLPGKEMEKKTFLGESAVIGCFSLLKYMAVNQTVITKNQETLRKIQTKINKYNEWNMLCTKMSEKKLTSSFMPKYRKLKNLGKYFNICQNAIRYYRN